MINTARLSAVLGAKWRRARQVGFADLLLGMLIRPRFTRAGILTVRPGLPLPAVENKGGHVEVGNCGFFPGVRIECWKGAVVKIGKGTYLNRNAEIVASSLVTIGADCMIAREVLIMDTDQHPLGDRGLVSKPVKIEDRVWIGSRAIVLKGVTIGHDSVIGAGAVVTKDVPPCTIAAGNPARVIRTLQDKCSATERS